MAELIYIIMENWEEKEELRMAFISHEEPKFGNDNGNLDLIARDLYCKVAEETKRFNTYYRTPGFIDGRTASALYSFAVSTWATPDGRKTRDPFHDGSITP
ncbi:MAG: pyruvate formate lyase family protein [Thermodesulfobacteriota bacterium]|nr:pyruvate formate lyase family protein [Thermodesulfobacteriota bacterium]